MTQPDEKTASGMTDEELRAAAEDRLTESEPWTEVDMTDLDDGDEPTARDDEAEAKQREAFDAIGVLN